MNRSKIVRFYDGLKPNKINKLQNDLYYYKHELQQTFQFLKDSKDFLEFKKMAKKISTSVYSTRFCSLINMGMVYFYALYEGFTRRFFERLLRYDTGISYGEFKKRYPEFKDIKQRVIYEIYKLQIPPQISNIIDILRKSRNGIVHSGKNSLQEFEIINICYNAIIGYFNLIEKELQ